MNTKNKPDISTKASDMKWIKEKLSAVREHLNQKLT